jgi:phage/plasmid-like protein (TIGR03299 family)
MQSRSHVALVRSDRKDSILAVVGKRYTPLQNAELFSALTPYVRSGAAEFETAGCLDYGRKVWGLLRLKIDPIDILPGDPLLPYLLASNAHDGSQCAYFQLTEVRVQCANTQAIAKARADEGLEPSVRCRHTSGIQEAWKTAQELLDPLTRQFWLSAEQFKAIAAKSLPIDGLENYVREVFELKPAEEAQRRSSVLDGVLAEYDNDELMGPSRGTYYGAFNAVTSYLEYSRPTRGGGGAVSRFKSSTFGTGAAIRERALTVALAS